MVAELATAVMVTDISGRVVIWNRAATHLFGWQRADVLGRPALPLLFAAEFELDAITAMASVAAGRRWVGELECKRRDGSHVPIRLTLSAVYDDDRAVIGFVGESLDITDVTAAKGHARDTERLFRSLLARTSEVACVTDAQGIVKYVVRSNESVLGYSAEELTGVSGFDLTHPDDVASLRKAFTDTVADPSLQSVVTYRSRAKDDTWRWREMRLSNLLDDPLIAGIVCNVSDATEQQALLRELRAADARQRAIVARSSDVTLFSDPDGTIRWASPVAADLIGGTPESLVGQNGFNFIDPADQERVFNAFVGMTDLGDHVRVEFRITDPRGDLRWVEEDVTNLMDDPDVGYVVSNIRDITDRKSAQEQLERLVLHDQLTGLPNQSLLVNRLEQLLARGTAAAVLYIDIDNFGDVNATLGHGAGDELLRLISGRFATAVARSDSTLARLGGDEFVLLCDDVSDAATAFSYAERLRDSLTLPVLLDGQEVFVSASIGVALTPGDATGLMRDAGIATQQAKQQGRDQVVVFDASLDVTQQRRLAVQSELHYALERDELVAWYQPIVDLQTDRVVGVEALVRWNHPERGLLGPDHFIDVAETSGLIRALGSQVLRNACMAAREWKQHGRPFRISVNAAAAQLSSPDYVTEIEAALNEFALDPRHLTIELTETAAMQIAGSLENLHRIRALGVHLALDDFGTGYSSLSFLRELPVDVIKVDRSFVSGLGTNERDTSIVQGVVAMAAALGFSVVGEGIETTVQADTLRQSGCGYAQGFLWSPPAPATDIEGIAHRIERNARPFR
ncbi:MAG: hypothetical protein JWL83_723 [Actinomycetia bacterium]|nr:hypothetical protein [Actinomycetes bacterium]